MTNQENDKLEANELRQKAEAELKIRKSTNTFSEVDNLKLIHELQVHQIELEMQNEELIKAHELAETVMEKYVELYDFAPSGYVTLSEEGEITDLNILTAKLLKNDRTYLKNTRFGLFVSPESLELFNDFFAKIFRFREKQSCELVLRSETNEPCYIHIDALVLQATNICLLTIIDITERKKMELELQETLNNYKDLNHHFIGRELKMIDLKKRINELLTKSGCEKEYII